MRGAAARFRGTDARGGRSTARCRPSSSAGRAKRGSAPSGLALRSQHGPKLNRLTLIHVGLPCVPAGATFPAATSAARLLDELPNAPSVMELAYRLPIPRSELARCPVSEWRSPASNPMLMMRSLNSAKKRESCGPGSVNSSMFTQTARGWRPRPDRAVGCVRSADSAPEGSLPRYR